MDADELTALLQQGESERVEWKKAGDVKRVAHDAVRTLTAFANDIAQVGQGVVVCGVEEEAARGGRSRAVPVGLRDADLRQLRHLVQAKCHDEVTPPIVPREHVVDLPGLERSVLVFEQPRSDEVHQYQGATRCASLPTRGWRVTARSAS